jgi:hypothetical protein
VYPRMGRMQKGGFLWFTLGNADSQLVCLIQLVWYGDTDSLHSDLQYIKTRYRTALPDLNTENSSFGIFSRTWNGKYCYI